MSEIKNVEFSRSESKPGLIQLVYPQDYESWQKGYYQYTPKRIITFTPDISKFMFDYRVLSAYVLYCTEEEAKEKVKQFD